MTCGPGAWIFLRWNIFYNRAAGAALFRIFATDCHKKQPEHLLRLCTLLP